jgi:hypothetical protein
VQPRLLGAKSNVGARDGLDGGLRQDQTLLAQTGTASFPYGGLMDRGGLARRHVHQFHDMRLSVQLACRQLLMFWPTKSQAPVAGRMGDPAPKS